MLASRQVSMSLVVVIPEIWNVINSLFTYIREVSTVIMRSSYCRDVRAVGMSLYMVMAGYGRRYGRE
jgi:hypothetical protein